MGKRKTNSASSRPSKIQKVDNKSSSGDEDKEKQNEKKLDEFRKRFGMVKDDSIDKNWIVTEDYMIYNPPDVKGSDKVALLDMDDTLIVSKSGNVFGKTWDDWRFMLTEVPGKIKSLLKDGWKVAIISNQGGLDKGFITLGDVKKKINSIIHALGVEMQVFIAIRYGTIYRKPLPGFLNLLEDKYNSNIPIDRSESCFVGDGAGRAAGWAPNKKKDFACTDRLFAINTNLKFLTPEEFFLHQKPVPFQITPFNPSDAVKQRTKLVIKYGDNLEKKTSDIHEILPKNLSKDRAVIILVGTPASGKSTFCARYLVPLGFVVVNRDTLKTWQKCVAETTKLLSAGKNVVIDNTNGEVEARSRYIKVAESAGVKHIICMIMDVSEDECKHNEMFRRMIGSEHDKINEMVYRIFKSKYEEPKMAEKFTSLCKVITDLSFESDEQRKLYSWYMR